MAYPSKKMNGIIINDSVIVKNRPRMPVLLAAPPSRPSTGRRPHAVAFAVPLAVPAPAPVDNSIERATGRPSALRRPG